MVGTGQLRVLLPIAGVFFYKQDMNFKEMEGCIFCTGYPAKGGGEGGGEICEKIKGFESIVFPSLAQQVKK